MNAQQKNFIFNYILYSLIIPLYFFLFNIARFTFIKIVLVFVVTILVLINIYGNSMISSIQSEMMYTYKNFNNRLVKLMRIQQDMIEKLIKNANKKGKRRA